MKTKSSHFCHLLFGLYQECPPLYGNLFVFRPHGLQRCDILISIRALLQNELVIFLIEALQSKSLIERMSKTQFNNLAENFA